MAHDDPSGNATYSQAGTQFGLGILWTMLLAFPLTAAVQSMCGNLGSVTGKGLAANIKAVFPPIVLYGVVAWPLAANTLSIAANVAAMGEAAELVTGVDRHLMTTVFVLATLLLQVFVPYRRYVFFLKWLALSQHASGSFCNCASTNSTTSRAMARKRSTRSFQQRAALRALAHGRIHELHRACVRGFALGWRGSSRSGCVPALHGSWEHVFHTTGYDRFFLPMRDDAARTLDEPMLERAIGVLYLPQTERQSHYFKAELASQFDALFHFDETSAQEPLEAAASWHRREGSAEAPLA